MDVGLALGRRFRGLKLWFLFRQMGATGLRALLRRHLGLAADFADWMRRDGRFELAAPVPFGTVCFRAHPQIARSGASEARMNVELADLEAALRPEAIKAAVDRGQARVLEEVAAEVLSSARASFP